MQAALQRGCNAGPEPARAQRPRATIANGTGAKARLRNYDTLPCGCLVQWHDYRSGRGGFGKLRSAAKQVLSAFGRRGSARATRPKPAAQTNNRRQPMHRGSHQDASLSHLRPCASHGINGRAADKATKLLRSATPVGFEPTRGDPIGLAGRRLNHTAKVSSKPPAIECTNTSKRRAGQERARQPRKRPNPRPGTAKQRVTAHGINR